MSCVSYEPSGDGLGEPIAEAAAGLSTPTQQVLPGGGVQLYAGECHHDGFVLEDGEIYRLLQYIGPDVTGVSTRARGLNGQVVCHNAQTWSALVEYMCERNTAVDNDVDSAVGTYDGHVDGPIEWVKKIPVKHPAQDVQGGFYFGHAVLPSRFDTTVFPAGDPCPGAANADFPLDHIECCGTEPSD